MENKNTQVSEELEVICAELLKRMTVRGEVRASIEYDGETGDQIIIIHISSPDADMLIGQGGSTMSALQHVARMFFRKKTPKHVRFIIDVNNYRQERRDLLRQLALSSASKVVSRGESIVLRPMSSYDRRIIHSALGEHGDVETESTGYSPGRRVVIKPKKK